MSEIKLTCKDCKYWVTEGLYDSMGACHLLPPARNQYGESLFARAYMHWWCGQLEPKVLSDESPGELLIYQDDKD